MRRREFIRLLAGTTAWPLGAHAQQPIKVVRIGFLGPASASTRPSYIEAFRAGLGELGYVEGKDFVIEFRWADEDYSRLPKLAAELVRLDVELIVTYTNQAVLAAKQATNTIPIVMALSGDAVRSGLVASLNRSGGNVTGQTVFDAEINAKRLELLREVLQQRSRVAVLFNPTNPLAPTILESMARTALSLNLELLKFEARQVAELADALSAAVGKGVGAIAVVDDTNLITGARSIADLAAQERLPSIGSLELVKAGGLMAYGVDFVEMWRHATVFVDRIIKGAKPDQLPIEQPTRFKFVINLKAAKVINLAIPATLLARADEIIE